MASVKISSVVEEKAWEELRALAQESHQSISGVLTEAIQDYVRRRRVRAVVLTELEASISKNEKLGELLAK